MDKKYLVDYEYKEHKYCIEIIAESWEEAEQRLKAIKNNGWVIGEIYATVKLFPIRNFIKKWLGI